MPVQPQCISQTPCVAHVVLHATGRMAVPIAFRRLGIDRIPTAAAATLNSESRAHFQGQGHGDDYYQAIIDQASFFGLTPEGLLASI